MVEDIQRLLEQDRRKYVFVGETHSSTEVLEQVLEPLMDLGCYENLYLEALLRGDYDDEQENLVPKMEKKVWHYNPSKYEETVDMAVETNISVHGLDNHGDSRKENKLEMGDWANYIQETAGSQNLIVVGNGHITQWPEKTFPRHLPSYFPVKEEITTIAEPTQKHDQENGFYKAEELDENAGDYVYLNKTINTEEQAKAIELMNIFRSS